MTLLQKQSRNDGARSDPNPDSGDGPSVNNVENYPLYSDSRVGYSTQHRVENQLMTNSSHSKRPTSGVSDLSKRTKSTIGSEDPAGVDDASAPGAETTRSFPIYREETLPAYLAEIGNLATGQFVVLESRWLDGSGIERIAKVANDSASTDIVFYIRQRSLDQIEFIRNSLEKHCDVGVIVGEPGTGKSTTAYLMAGILAFHMNKVVIWIHVGMERKSRFTYKCVVMSKGGCSKFELSSPRQFQAMCMRDWDIHDDHAMRLLFVDGYTDEYTETEEINDFAIDWADVNPTQRHVIFLSSMGSPNVLTKAARLRRGIGRFHQSPWAYDEYLCTLSNPDFRRSVASQLAPIGAEVDSLENLVANADLNLRLKYYYAGGCARFMFQLSSREVKQFIDDSLTGVKDVELLLSTTAGHARSRLEQSLISVFRSRKRRSIKGDDIETYRTLVSQYVEVCVGRRLHISSLVDQAKLFDPNSVMFGWIFEEFFFKKICVDRMLPLITSESSEAGHFPAGSSPFIFFDPEYLTSDDCPVREWLRPRKFNQGGFDAVWLEPDANSEASGTVIFVQCTTAEKHDAKLHYCKNFIDKARETGIYVATKVEFYFIIPFRHLRFFSIGSIVSPQSFAGLSSSSSVWGRNGDEAKRNLTVRGIRGWTSDT
jgi:hypothetical protein